MIGDVNGIASLASTNGRIGSALSAVQFWDSGSLASPNPTNLLVPQCRRSLLPPKKKARRSSRWLLRTGSAFKRHVRRFTRPISVSVLILVQSIQKKGSGQGTSHASKKAVKHEVDVTEKVGESSRQPSISFPRGSPEVDAGPSENTSNGSESKERLAKMVKGGITFTDEQKEYVLNMNGVSTCLNYLTQARKVPGS